MRGNILACLAISALLAVSSCGRRTPAEAGAGAAPVPPIPSAGAVALPVTEGSTRPDEPEEALRFYVAQRAPDGLHIPIERLAKAPAHVRAMRKYSIAAGRHLTSDVTADDAAPGQPTGWTSLGPTNVGGRTRTLLINPNDPTILYAGARGGGVWKSTDAGASWAPVSPIFPTVDVHTLAFDPTNPDTIYAGTGDNLAGIVPIRGRGIFVSPDAGASWNRLPGTNDANFYYVNKLVVSKSNPGHIYAATGTGVMASLDGGQTWTRTLTRLAPSTGCQDLAIRTDQASDFLIAACGTAATPQGGVYRNVDTASPDSKWEVILAVSNMGRTALALAPSNQGTVYALLTDSGVNSTFSSGMLGFYRSDSNGDANSWVQLVSQTNANRTNVSILSYPNSAFADICGTAKPAFNGQGYHDIFVAVDPVNPDRVWAGGIDLFRSDDGGSNWGIAMFWEAGSPIASHADNHQIVFHPKYDADKNQTVYNSNDGGIYVTTNANAEPATGPRAGCRPYGSKIQWKSLNNSYSVTEFYDGAVFPGASIVLAGAQDNGTLIGYAANQGSFDVYQGGDGGYVMINPKDPNEIYTNFTGLSLARSLDGGNSTTSIIRGITEAAGNFVFIAPVNMDPNQPSRIYIGGRALWRSSNRGDTWEQASTLATSLQGQISAITVSPTDSNVVMYGTTGGYIFRSNSALATDSNTTWTVSRPRNSGWVSRIAFDPGDPNTAYVSYRTYTGTGEHYVYKTNDGGQSWIGIDGSSESRALPDAPVHSVVVDPLNPQTLYVGTEYGIFTSLDAGNSWLADPNSFADVPVPQLIVDRSSGVTTLVAITFGRGVWKATIPDSGTPCQYNLGATALSMDALGTELALNVDTADGCVWTANPVSSYLYSRSPAVGTGAGTARLYGVWNVSTLARTGQVAVADKLVSIAQQPADFTRANDQNAASITALPYLGYADTRGFTSNPADPVQSCTKSAGFKSAWWSFVAPNTGSVEVSARGQRLDASGNSGIVLTVYDTNRTANEELGCTSQARNTSSPIVVKSLQIAVMKGKTYQIEVTATGDTPADGGLAAVAVVNK